MILGIILFDKWKKIPSVEMVFVVVDVVDSPKVNWKIDACTQCKSQNWLICNIW